jgi:hypothetical protein
MTRFVRLLMASFIALAGATASVQAADPVSLRFDEPGICGSAQVLNKITRNFRYQVAHVPHLPQVEIVDFDRIAESRFKPQTAEWPIERRYCHAKVDLSNGHKRDVWYLIERPMGFAGKGSNVEFCVSGFDRWNVYGGRCLSLR